MLPEEKRAVFLLALWGAIAVAFVLVMLALPEPRSGLLTFLTWGGIGLSGMSISFFLKRGEIQDERDLAIASRANKLGLWVSFMIFYIGCFPPWVFLGRGARDAVPALYLQCVGLAGIAVYFLVRAAAVLVLYRRWGGDAKD